MLPHRNVFAATLHRTIKLQIMVSNSKNNFVEALHLSNQRTLLSSDNAKLGIKKRRRK